MARGYQVGIASETKAFKQGVEKGIIDPLEDAQKELLDLGKNRGPEQLETDLKGAQKATERLADEIKQTARQFEQSSKDAGRDLKKGIGDGLDEVKDEARQSGKEAAASFSGEFEDVTDYVQEVVAQGLGPAGIAGAALIGAVAATVTAAVEAWNEKVQGIKDATAEMWQAAAAEGQAFLDGEAIRSEAHRILWDDAFKDEFESAEKYGIKRSDLAIALATGEGEVFDRVHQQFMAAREEEARKTRENYDQYVEDGTAVIELESAEGQQIGRTLDLLGEKARSVDENKKKRQEAAQVETQLEEQQRAQIQRTRDADQKRYEAMAERYSKPIKAKVEVEVDDSAWRRWNPNPKTGQVNARFGRWVV